jgi:DNA helicase HerA-like ATPase
MTNFLEQFVARLWNRLRRRRPGAWHEGGNLDLGFRVLDEAPTRRRISLSNTRRTTGVALLGKTGSGKSSLLRYLAAQDISADRGFAFFDPHGDAIPYLLRTINARERRERRHLSHKLILIQPADPIMSVGLNPLEQETPDFVRIADVAEAIRRRSGLDHFGVRIEETLRNALFVLAANGLTLIELPLLLTDAGFRAACMKLVPNAEVRQYFESRYDEMSDAMQATVREPVLNKITAFIADPHFRHILGQAHSTFSIKEAMDEGYWILIDLPKSRLGNQALTLGSLIFTAIKNALFTREKRSLFTIYVDEIQNFIGSDIETVFSEARKFSAPITSANQTLEQLPTELRSALLAVGTNVFFQLSPADASLAAQALDGGKTLAERLKNLPQRHAIVKSGSDRWVEIAVPTISDPKVDYTDLLNRVRYTRGRVRAHIERDIAERRKSLSQKTDEVLHDWD